METFENVRKYSNFLQTPAQMIEIFVGHEKASAFAKSSVFAEATPDKSADRLQHKEKLDPDFTD